MEQRREPRILLVPMHPGIQYHFARVGLPTSILGHWDQFQYWRPKPSNVFNLISQYAPQHLTFGLSDYRRLLDEIPSYPELFDVAWLHFPWQLKLFWNDPIGRKIYFAAKEDELSVEEWGRLLGRSDFVVVSYYRRTTEWVKRTFGVQLQEIQLGVCPHDYGDWTGSRRQILTVIHSWKERGWHYADYREATRRLPAIHVDHLDKSQATVGYAALLELFRECRVYLHDGEREYTIVLIEAMMTGMPIVSFALPGIEAYVIHGVNGFVGRDADEIRDYCELLLNDHSLAARFGAASRSLACKQHHEARWRADWRRLIGVAK
jgi:glycosyltransferase involved in cell wall biosynthesis